MDYDRIYDILEHLIELVNDLREQQNKIYHSLESIEDYLERINRETRDIRKILLTLNQRQIQPQPSHRVNPSLVRPLAPNQANRDLPSALPEHAIPTLPELQHRPESFRPQDSSSSTPATKVSKKRTKKGQEEQHNEADDRKKKKKKR